MTQKISVTEALRTILFYSELVDRQEWKIESLTTNSFYLNDLSLAQQNFQKIRQEFMINLKNFPTKVYPSCRYFEDKLKHFENKLISLQTFGTTITHQQFTNAIPNFTQNHSQYSSIPPSSYHTPSYQDINTLFKLEDKAPQIYKPLSFSVENGTDNQPTPSHLQTQVSPPDLAALGDKGRKTYRTTIMNETLETLKNGYYINSKGQKVTLDLQPSIQSLYCESTSGETRTRDGKYNTQIFLDKKDCLTVTHDCIKRGLNPIVLDAASDNHFGGGYKTGAGAQEENICRRSGLCYSVDPMIGMQTKDFYPLNKQGSHAGLYVSNVPVFRGEEKEGYPYLDQPFETAVGIFAAYNFNEHHQPKNGIPSQNIRRLIIDQKTGKYRLPDPEAHETKQKLRNFFHVAQTNRHDSVVLIPWGCGAFCNPPKHICEMAMELITQEFPHSFKEIHFSIIDDHNTGKAHNPRGNYVEFQETIENEFLKTGTVNNIGATFTT
jgi:uncharacterized protein (TIGR02452 family)